VSSSAPKPGSARQRVARGPVRVLLVVDTRMLVELVKLTLNPGAYVVEAAPSVAEAVVRLPELQPHLIILNMDLDGQ
jgi:CheY-like chemotaxis protein